MRTPSDPGSRRQPLGDALNSKLLRNIDAITERRRQEAQQERFEARVADRITRFTGSMTFVYLHLTVFALWILVNLGVLPIVPKFDPSFVVLAMTASVEAIFLSTFVLISQNRMMAAADRRDDLDLQINLLTEHEVTKLARLVRAMAEKLGVPDAHDEELREIEHDVPPEAVLDMMDEKRPDAG